MKRWVSSVPVPSARTLAAMACIGASGYAAHRVYRYMWPGDKPSKKDDDRSVNAVPVADEPRNMTTKDELDRLVTELIQAADIEERASFCLPLPVLKPRANAETCVVDSCAVSPGPQAAFELPAVEKNAASLAPNAPPLVHVADAEESATSRSPLVPKPLANADTFVVRSCAASASPQVAIELPEVEKEAAVLKSNASDVGSEPAKLPPPTAQRRCIVMVSSQNISSEEEELFTVITKNLGELRIPFTKLVLGDHKKGMPTRKYGLIVRPKFKATYPQIFVEDYDTGLKGLHVPNAYVAEMVKIQQERTAGTMAATASIPKPFCVEFVFKGVEKTPLTDSLSVGEATETTSVSVNDMDSVQAAEDVETAPVAADANHAASDTEDSASE